MRSRHTSEVVRVWISFLFLGLGLALLWLGVRAGKPWELATSWQSLTAASCHHTFHEQLAREMKSACSTLAPTTVRSINGAFQARDWSTVLVAAERLPMEQQENPAIVLYRAGALLELNRHAKAAVESEKLLGCPHLGWGLRTSA